MNPWALLAGMGPTGVLTFGMENTITGWNYTPMLVEFAVACAITLTCLVKLATVLRRHSRRGTP